MGHEDERFEDVRAGEGTERGGDGAKVVADNGGHTGVA